MIVLGLTGSIGMGKSTLAAMMESLHIPVHDADICVHRLLGPNSPAIPALAAAFPLYEYPQIYDRKTKTILRKDLGALVFAQDFLRARLESILHPLVRKEQTDFLRANRLKGVKTVCLDIPLLFETGAQSRVDYTITVSAPYIVQEQRVLSRPGMTQEKFNAILARQMPDAEKCARSDYVIKTGAGRAHTLKSLKQILKDIETQNRRTEKTAC